MATNSTSHLKRNLKGFTSALKSAACECFLIVLLFFYAAFSYLLTRFAHYCGLQAPCILCSRLDHVFRNEKPGYYWNLFCSNHRSEVSSLVSCNIHGKLVDGRGMCDNCLSSDVEENKSNSDIQRVSLENLGFEPACFGNCDSQSSFFNRDLSPASKSTRFCLCCDKPWTPRPNAQGLPPLKSRGVAVAKANFYLSRRLRHRNGPKKSKDKFSAPALTHIGNTGIDTSPHAGFTELKITSESESEIPFSDDEVSNCMVLDMNESKKESLVHSAPETPSKRLYNNLVKRKQPDSSEPHDFRYFYPNVHSENYVCDRKGQLADKKTNSSVLPELISLDDIPASSCLVGVPSYSASLLSDLISLVDKPPSVNVMETPLEASSRKHVTGASKNENISINKTDKSLKSISTSAGAGFETDQVVDDTAVVHSAHEDLNAVNTSPVYGEEKGASVFVTEEPMLRYNKGVSKYPSLSVQNSSGEGIDLSFNNVGSEFPDDDDDFETTDESNPYGVQSFDNLFSAERSEFGSFGVNEDQSLAVQNSSEEGIHLSPELQGHSDDFETTNESDPYGVQSFDNLLYTERSEFDILGPLNESTFSEIEGEDPVDRLKRQVEHYQKCMDGLYKELEEERNASAIAANQAMAMITRLQEEKSNLQMEGLHYLRMMEEQAEYDGDALDKANDLLAEREKELQDLEAELEFYRLNFTDETQIENLTGASINLSNGHVSTKTTSTFSVKDDLKFPSNTMFPDSDNPVAKSAWSEFEDEKLYISERLRDLERKASKFARHGTLPHISDRESLDEAANGGQHQQESLDESAPSQELSNTSVSEDQVVSKGNSHMVSNGQKGSENCNETGLASVENEISDLNEKLEALVADYKFLENSLKSLQIGNEGLLLIQEILHELRELRKLGIRRRNMSAS
ncbi:myosin-binding protein 1 [Gossypium raimondii]|uniref:GTD-binding domain-containing protein n=1 Tax=Gossypium raimondii TaxID=29730 RepID=A0A0D2RU21_GOSRA|nr:myosin-binding protein 1 [Gossypium raimondii]XP_012473563.1 myosin-binding protein 1 [Gossypium raimondii]XP_012473564.1 myosin-binding protein 1 [Gossypium raimondii]XP_052491054.1 myosin-binding protein 1 [Gossypium raimondii]XP_052491055.1 myosin-binding protein 1 [Gossypium raimondii]KJB22598.1 hypothetical protein B456_004G056900 [Gossypium raimondii]KJB22599.1 hypothetical protein B456_004G056900 [Gossypium raimondii]KJB22600.1 hypothetical protein B456_004G056900 [Gossypium raimon